MTHLEVGLEPAGRGDDDVDALFHRRALLVEGAPVAAAVHADRADAGVVAQAHHLALDLHRELAGGRDDEGVDVVVGPVAEPVEHGDEEGARLPGARLGDREEVVAGDPRGDRLLLDGGGFREAHVVEAVEQVGVEPHVFESQSACVFA